MIETLCETYCNQSKTCKLQRKADLYRSFQVSHLSELQRQIAILLGRQQVFIDLADDYAERTDLTELINNTTTSQNFLALAREVIFRM